MTRGDPHFNAFAPVPVCFKCGLPIQGDYISSNVAPDAASGGVMRPFHRTCAPIRFHGPAFVDPDLRAFLIWHETDIAREMGEFALLQESFKRIVGREPKALGVHPEGS